jgi:hypothetical protein
MAKIFVPLLIIAVIAGVIYVVAHFILKYW